MAMGPIRVHLVCSAPTHDTNYARPELLKALHEDPRVWVTIGDDFSDVVKMAEAQALVVYTCNISPNEIELDALEAFVERGGRMFAMHATNALIRFTDGPPIIAQGIEIPGQVDTTDFNPLFTRLLGSRFLAHLLLGPMHVEVAGSANPLVAGLDDFDVTDEPYIVELIGPAEVLLTARFGGSNPAYVLSDWEEASTRRCMSLHDAVQATACAAARRPHRGRGAHHHQGKQGTTELRVPEACGPTTTRAAVSCCGSTMTERASLRAPRWSTTRMLSSLRR
jgi:type 1 glutamine amidotransferase